MDHETQSSIMEIFEDVIFLLDGIDRKSRRSFCVKASNFSKLVSYHFSLEVVLSSLATQD